MRRLTVLYDGSCPLCVGLAQWLAGQPACLPLEILSSRGRVAARRYPQLAALGGELVVVADTGETWIGPPALVICLWALEAHRGWSAMPSHPYRSS